MKLITLLTSLIAGLSLLACQPVTHSEVTESDLLSLGYETSVSIILNNSFQVVGPLGEPIAEAQVLIGTAPGIPFEGNLVQTDGKGQFLIPEAWTEPLSVTVEGPGYLRQTFIKVNPEPADLMLSFNEPEGGFKVQGVVSGFENIQIDGKVDFGLIIPAITKDEFLRFDLTSVLSPENDDLKIGTFKIGIPSNTSIPEQRENYKIIPVKLNKPEYRLFFKKPGQYRLIANHAQFPLDRVVRKITSGASILEVVNYFDFQSAGTTDLEVVSTETNADLAINQIKFDQQIEVQAPSFESDEVLFGITAFEKDNLLIPSDLKLFNSGDKLNLKTLNEPKRYKIFLLAKKGEDLTRPLRYSGWVPTQNSPRELVLRLFSNLGQFSGSQPMSISLQPLDSSLETRFLPFIPGPQVSGQVMTLTPPPADSEFLPMGTLITLSEVETVGGGEIPLERKRRVWESLSKDWIESFDLPQLDSLMEEGRSYRWEVTFFAQRIEPGATPDPQPSLDNVTHITRSFIDL